MARSVGRKLIITCLERVWWSSGFWQTKKRNMQAIVICGMEMASMIGRMKNHYNETFGRERVQEHVDEPCVDEVLVISDLRPILVLL